MLIDKNGKIVYKGDPAKRSNVEQDFEDLLVGKEIFVEEEAELYGESPEVKELSQE
jgi:hypothetical protein